MRQLIANGHSKVALETAKQFHKAEHNAASESLLIEAYKARIHALLDQNMASDAKALVELVEERFPNSKTVLHEVQAAARARTGDLDELLAPLSDAQSSVEQRAIIEHTIQTQLMDLEALANCGTLPAEHSLRQAARALNRAFEAATTGPVQDEQIALPEVSHRSPLAAWKWLLRAIVFLHRGEDEQCRECLAAIKPDSIPARAVPAMQEILAGGSAATLKPAERALVSRISANVSDLRNALEDAERAFAKDDDGQIFRAVHVAVRECQRNAADLVPILKQMVHVRASVVGLDSKRLATALDGNPIRDANYNRMFARALEVTREHDPDDLADACEHWDRFRELAVNEGIFERESLEMATLYLHIADTAGRIPARFLRDLERFDRRHEQYYLYPEKLYARACAIDPHSETFSRWFIWANAKSASEGERIAKEWHKANPGDIEPVLHLMKQAEKKSAFASALGYLEKAEQIDAVHSTVRAARLRLLAAATIRHLQQQKPHLAVEKLRNLAALPQAQQGDRPAFLAALSALVLANTGDLDGAKRALQETESLLGGLCSGMLLFGIAMAAKRRDLASLPEAHQFKADSRETIPACLARVMAMARDFGVKKFVLPVSFFDEAEKQFARVSNALDLEQIRALGELGIATDHPRLAWAASVAGLKRSGPADAFFLLLRVRALPGGGSDRHLALAAAAAELGRFHRDTDVVDEAVELLRDAFEGNPLRLTLEQAREVVRKEAALTAFPGLFDGGPDYSDLLPEVLCQCANCRKKRGEIPNVFEDNNEDPFDEDDDPLAELFDMSESEMRNVFNRSLPKDVPPDMANILFDVMKESFRRGESPEKLLEQALGNLGMSPKKPKKGRRK